MGRTIRVSAGTWTLRVGVPLLAAAAGFLAGGCPVVRWPVTLTSLSPDDAHRVVLVERPVWIDRQFEVRLVEIGSGHERTVFRSPDEGWPVGSERVVWSADGSRFLLLGRHFNVTDEGHLPAGEQAYLMMDVRSGQVWCNNRSGPEHTRFGAGELRAVRWLSGP